MADERAVAADAAAVMAPRPQHRTFRAYNVGLAKTGTRTIAGMFSRYRCLHEYLQVDTVEAVEKRRQGRMSHEDFRAFIRWRDGLTYLDMDASSFNCYYVDVLRDEFPDAKLLFVIRDCFSWLDSLLNMCMHGAGMLPSYMLVDYMQWFLGPAFVTDLADDTADLDRALPEMVECAWLYWATWNRFVLDNLPPNRSLILRTPELSASVEPIAALVGVPVETLNTDLGPLNQAKEKFHLLLRADGGLLLEQSERLCGDLMREFFPEVNLGAFLEADARSAG